MRRQHSAQKRERAHGAVRREEVRCSAARMRADARGIGGERAQAIEIELQAGRALRFQAVPCES